MSSAASKPPIYVLDHVAKRIAGDVALSGETGFTLKKWREFFGLSMKDLAETMGVSISVLSDYERGRRKPGRSFINSFVSALFKHDAERGWRSVVKLAKLLDIYVEGVLDVGLFAKPMVIDEFVKTIDGVTLSPVVEPTAIRGYVIVDSVKSIESLSTDEYVKLMSLSIDKAVLFTNITRGRSVLVATRISPVKPRVIVLHKVVDVDPLALRISELEKITLVVTHLEVEEAINRLRTKVTL